MLRFFVAEGFWSVSWRCSLAVYAIYPQTTCFYKGKIHRQPATPLEDYQICFEDSTYPNSLAPPVAVAQRYVFALRDKKGKAWIKWKFRCKRRLLCSLIPSYMIRTVLNELSVLVFLIFKLVSCVYIFLYQRWIQLLLLRNILNLNHWYSLKTAVSFYRKRASDKKLLRRWTMLEDLRPN
jgi:hypothetical protein